MASFNNAALNVHKIGESCKDIMNPGSSFVDFERSLTVDEHHPTKKHKRVFSKPGKNHKKKKILETYWSEESYKKAERSVMTALKKLGGFGFRNCVSREALSYEAKEEVRHTGLLNTVLGRSKSGKEIDGEVFMVRHHADTGKLVYWIHDSNNNNDITTVENAVDASLPCGSDECTEIICMLRLRNADLEAELERMKRAKAPDDEKLEKKAVGEGLIVDTNAEKNDDEDRLPRRLHKKLINIFERLPPEEQRSIMHPPEFVNNSKSYFNYL